MALPRRTGGAAAGSAAGAGDITTLLRRHSDVGLALVVVVIVGMMIIPLPLFILDLFIVANMAASVVLLLVAIYVTDALKIATFPTLLLITTLFRLALEVSATRLILLKADAGHVIEAFGNFVVSGNLVVGAVIFFILTMIQFIVIAKGSERVAEVGARFTLDAMPGKQMSIDAELRAGHIDHAQARRRRSALARESQFFGSMDGAMKFVKGDAIAGIIVLVTNIVGGLIIGIVQRGMDAGTAARTYTVLTIGEGLVAQIPALIISTAAGVIVTRVASEEEGTNLGAEIFEQLTGQPKALAIAAGLLLLLAIVPGFPAVPFLVLAGALGFVALRLMKTAKAGAVATRAAAGAAGAPAAAAKDAAAAAKPDAASAAPPPAVLTPIFLDLSPEVVELLEIGSDGGRFVKELVPALRERVFQ
ncbi:MAG TPA: flagellar biosynthesis protein FlhA, partial [Polyangia bacterium]